MKKKIKGLTPKESAILELLTTGLLYKEIAARKSISIVIRLAVILLQGSCL